MAIASNGEELLLLKVEGGKFFKYFFCSKKFSKFI